MLVGYDTDQTYTSDQLAEGKGFALGDRTKTHDGKEFVFVQASGAITGAGYVVSIDESFQAAMVDTDTSATVAEGMSLGIPVSAFADNEYGWVQVYGPCSVRTAASAAANAKIGPTATAGELDDGIAKGSGFADGLVLGTATGGQAAVNTTAFANYPRIALVGTYV